MRLLVSFALICLVSLTGCRSKKIAVEDTQSVQLASMEQQTMESLFHNSVGTFDLCLYDTLLIFPPDSLPPIGGNTQLNPVKIRHAWLKSKAQVCDSLDLKRNDSTKIEDRGRWIYADYNIPNYYSDNVSIPHYTIFLFVALLIIVCLCVRKI